MVPVSVTSDPNFKVAVFFEINNLKTVQETAFVTTEY